MWWFIIVSTLMLVLIYTYIGRRLIKPLLIKQRRKRILWIFLWLIPVMQPAGYLLRTVPDPSFIKTIFGWISYLGFGFFSLILAALLLRDFLVFIRYLSVKIKSVLKENRRVSPPQKQLFDPQRRRFLVSTTNYGIIGLSAVMTGYGLYEARRQPQLERIEIPIRNLPGDLEGFTIAQFTDLHASMTIRRKFIRSVVNQVNQLGADVIVFTGDLVDGTVEGLRYDVAPLKGLKAAYGVYFVTGNHEYYSGAEAWIEEARQLGMRVLINENEIINYQQHKILLAGVTDYSAADFIPSQRSDPQKAGRTGENPAVRILLAHQPKSIFDAARAGFDLQISGHTHGGQYYPWNFLATLTQPYVSGLHRYDKTWIYVSRGTGYWGPPIRLGVPSEVTLLTLRRAE